MTNAALQCIDNADKAGVRTAVIDDGEEIGILGQVGFAEEHHARW